MLTQLYGVPAFPCENRRQVFSALSTKQRLHQASTSYAHDASAKHTQQLITFEYLCRSSDLRRGQHGRVQKLPPSHPGEHSHHARAFAYLQPVFTCLLKCRPDLRFHDRWLAFRGQQSKQHSDLEALRSSSLTCTSPPRCCVGCDD